MKKAVCYQQDQSHRISLSEGHHRWYIVTQAKGSFEYRISERRQHDVTIYLMMFFVILLCVSIGTIHSISLSVSSDVETHTFRWAFGNDLNKTRCVFPTTPFRFPNDTLHPDPNWSLLYRSRNALFY